MRKLVVTTFVSLDGVMQSPGSPDEDRGGGFEFGGWLVPYMDASLATFSAEWIGEADGFLLGRKSYEVLGAYWPHLTDPDGVLAAPLPSADEHFNSTTVVTPLDRRRPPSSKRWSSVVADPNGRS